MNTFKIKSLLSKHKLFGLALLLSSLLVFFLSACYRTYQPDETRQSQTLPLTETISASSLAAATTSTAATASPSTVSTAYITPDYLDLLFPAAAQLATVCELTSAATSSSSVPTEAKMKTEPAQTCPATKASSPATTKQKTSSTTSQATSCPPTAQTTTTASTAAPAPTKQEPAPTLASSKVDPDPVQEMFAATNALRQKNGLAPLKNGSTAMNAAAQQRARELAVTFEHKRPDGSSFAAALKDAGVSYSCAAENIANFPASASVADVLAKWEASAGHRANMLRQDLTCLAIGLYSHNGRLYWVQLFTDS